VYYITLLRNIQWYFAVFHEFFMSCDNLRFYGKTISGGDDMKEKHNKIPVPEPRTDEGYGCPSAAWTEMSVHTPDPSEDEHKRNSYGDIPPYSA